MRYEVGRSCSFTPFSCLGTISSPYIAQMTPNLAQVCISTWQMMLAPFHAKLVWKFSKKLKFWHIFVKHVPKSSLQSRKGSYGEMPQHIWTSEHHFKPCRKLLHYSKSVVNRSLTKSSEFHKKIKKPQIPLKPSPMASLCQLMSMKNNIREETIFARQSSK